MQILIVTARHEFQHLSDLLPDWLASFGQNSMQGSAENTFQIIRIPIGRKPFVVAYQRDRVAFEPKFNLRPIVCLLVKAGSDVFFFALKPAR
jgi:hypothetical protein